MTNIKQHTLQSGERILIVQVPEYSIENPIIADIENTESEAIVWSNNEQRIHYDMLPQGNWQLIGLSDEITEEQAKELVLTRVDQSSFPTSMEYCNYLSDRMVHLSFDFDTALESFKSLMQSLGCVGRYAVLKEVKA